MFFFYGPWFFLGPFYLPIVFFVVKRDKSTLCRTNQIGPATDEVSNPKFHDESAQAYFLSTLGSRKKVEWTKNYLFRWLSFQASIMSLRRFLRQSCRRTFRTTFVISRQLIEDIIAVKLHYCVLWRTGRKVVIEASSLPQWPWSYPRHWTPHLLLVKKVQAYGLDNRSCSFLLGYLQNKLQRDKIEDAVSSWEFASRGLPQGSILGPLFFNVFVNELAYFITGAHCDTYTDDSKCTILILIIWLCPPTSLMNSLLHWTGSSTTV